MRSYWLLALILLVQAAAVAVAAASAPLEASKDLVWPRPATFATGPQGSGRVVLGASRFTIRVPAGATVLARAAERYRALVFGINPSDQSQAEIDKALARLATAQVLGNNPVLEALDVQVTDLSVELGFGVDESFNLAINGPGVATIRASTVWGALRGMETFSQLVQGRGDVFSIEDLPVTASGGPRFPHRGLLLDSARHYLPLPVIRRVIDALAYNNMNVLHWHIVDAESFPFISPRSPLLHLGAYTPEAVYSKADVAGIIEYARMRGIRVILEIDMPGHAYSWGHGYPSVVAKCPRYEHNINNIPLNPAVDLGWTVIDGLLRDLLGDLNRDQYFHIGGDEVVYGCWRQDDVLMAWAERQGFTDMVQVMKYFQERLWQVVGRFNTSMIVWEEVLTDYGLTEFPKDMVIHVWKNPETLLKAASRQQPAIMSHGWYVDHLQRTWKDMYLNEPFAGPGWTEKDKKYVLGGEAAAWAEMISHHNLDVVLWPRTSAVAERLWSPAYVADDKEAIHRLNLHVCRMNRRGIAAAPVRPNFCYY